MPRMNMETIPISDWSGFTDHGGSAEVYAPANEREVSQLVQFCAENRKKLRVVGRRTAWNTLWYSQDAMMVTNRLNRILDINVDQRTITCEAGATLAEIHRALWEKGLTLNTAPAVDWVTVGGAISTGSHGSGPASISSNLAKCRLVLGTGEVVEIDEADDRFDAVRISLGLLGVLSTVTLNVVDAFHVSVKRTRIPTTDWKRFLSEGQMSYLLWFPHTEYSVHVRVDVLHESAPHPPAEDVRANDAAGDDQTIEPQTGDAFHSNRCRLALGEMANIFPSTFPARNRYLLDVFYRDTETAGPAHEMVMSFESEPIAGAEWALPVARFEAAFADLREECSAGGLYLPIVWLKKVEPESAWLSAADERSVQCGIYHDVIPETPSHVQAMVQRVEQIMLRYGGRPHLSKLIYLKPSELKQVYGNWSRFDALRRQLDPNGVFWSEAIDARFGDAT